MQTKGLVSVIINCRNSERFLRQCIDSVINQTYKNLQIIIVDNQSTDNTKEIIDSYQDNRIKYFNTLLSLSLGAGSGEVGSAGSWGTSTYEGVTGQTNLIATNGATWQITGVQLEAGTSATDFEQLPFDVNLSRCQRYYEKNFDYATAAQGGQSYASTQTTLQATAYATSALRHYAYFKTRKRTTPTASFYYVTGLAGGSNAGKWDVYNGGWAQTSTATATGESDEQGMDINIAHSGFTSGNGYLVGGGGSVDAEL